MNIQSLAGSQGFNEFMGRVAEMGGEAADLLKTESDLLKIGRAQGRLAAIQDILDLPAQIEAEQRLHTED